MNDITFLGLFTDKNRGSKSKLKDKFSFGDKNKIKLFLWHFFDFRHHFYPLNNTNSGLGVTNDVKRHSYSISKALNHII